MRLYKMMQRFYCGLILLEVVAFPAIILAAPPDVGQILVGAQQVEERLPAQQQVELTLPGQPTPINSEDNGFRVLVKAFKITGQTIYTQKELRPILAPFMEKELSLDDLQQAAAKLAQYFYNRGYIVVQAYLPPQEIEDGVVEIAVRVGRYGAIHIKNNSSFATDDVIRGQLAVIQPWDYITQDTLERAVLLAGDLAGVSAKIDLTPGKTSGLSDVTVEVVDSGNCLEGGLSANNWGNRFTGSNQGNVSLVINGLSRRGDTFTADFTSGSGLTSNNVTYRRPVGEGSYASASFSAVQYEVGEEYDDLGLNGTSYTAHADLFKFAPNTLRQPEHTFWHRF